MNKKDEFIHIRADDELKAALAESARLCERKLTDQARYLLRVILGLSAEHKEEERIHATALKHQAIKPLQAPKAAEATIKPSTPRKASRG